MLLERESIERATMAGQVFAAAILKCRRASERWLAATLLLNYSFNLYAWNSPSYHASFPRRSYRFIYFSNACIYIYPNARRTRNSPIDEGLLRRLHRSLTIVFEASHRALLLRADYRRHGGLHSRYNGIIVSRSVLYVSGAVHEPRSLGHGSVFRSEIAHRTSEMRFRRHEEMIGDTRKCRQQRLRELLPAAYCLIRLMTRRKRNGGPRRPSTREIECAHT